MPTQTLAPTAIMRSGKRVSQRGDTDHVIIATSLMQRASTVALSPLSRWYFTTVASR